LAAGDEVSAEHESGEELFSAQVKAGSRTYFIDVQQAAKLWNLSASSDLAEMQRSLKGENEGHFPNFRRMSRRSITES